MKIVIRRPSLWLSRTVYGMVAAVYLLMLVTGWATLGWWTRALYGYVLIIYVSYARFSGPIPWPKRWLPIEDPNLYLVSKNMFDPICMLCYASEQFIPYPPDVLDQDTEDWRWLCKNCYNDGKYSPQYDPWIGTVSG